MAEPTVTVQLRTSPHVWGAPSVDKVMRHVIYALLPVCAFAVYEFGISALALLLATTGGCMLTEAAICRLSDKPHTVGDGSAIITGMLLALTLPPGFPLWMALVAAFIAIALGKMFFGGIGYNVFNPALVGRAFVQASFAVSITTWTPARVTGRFTHFIPSTWTLPFMMPPSVDQWCQEVATDGFTGATPLALFKFDHVSTGIMDLFTGMTAGSAGETSALLILICGAYLVLRKMMDWRIPAAVLLSAFLSAGAFYLADPGLYPHPLFVLFSGGLMLGAMFMASDMVASPVTPWGVWLYGGLIGFVTVIIRLFGGLSEGVMYAILLGNAATPLIESMTQPRIYGARRKRPTS